MHGRRMYASFHHVTELTLLHLPPPPNNLDKFHCPLLCSQQSIPLNHALLPIIVFLHSLIVSCIQSTQVAKLLDEEAAARHALQDKLSIQELDNAKARQELESAKRSLAAAQADFEQERRQLLHQVRTIECAQEEEEQQQCFVLL